MGDRKRILYAGIVSIFLHSFLVMLHLPGRESLSPNLKGNPIRVKITASSSTPVVSPKKLKRTATDLPQTAIEEKKVVVQEVDRQPVVTEKQQKKVILKAEKKKTEQVVEEKYPITELAPQQSVVPKKESRVQVSEKNIELPANEPVEHVVTEQSVVAESRVVQEEGQVEAEEEAQPSAPPINRRARPNYLQNRQPPYPVMAKRRGYDGNVLLHVLVDTMGQVFEVQIKQSSGHSSLDRAALKTVKEWMFTPGTENGKPVSMWVDVPIRFQLN